MFNLRKSNTEKSNTEPVIRLNVETRQDVLVMQAKTEELLSKMRA